MQLPDFSKSRVLVAGDLMLDRYWHGGTSRISPEAPVPVVHVGEIEERAGGAGNVALNIAVLGSAVSLLGYTGDDEAATSLIGLMEGFGVECHVEKIPTRPTITKLRVMSRHQQLIRLDFEDRFKDISPDKLYDKFDQQLVRSDVVILSDYGKGTIQDFTSLIDRARAQGKPVLVDPKGTDFSMYRGVTLITPNRSEFEAVVGACHDEVDLVARGLALMDSIALEALLVTRGEEGMTLLQRGEPPLHLPAHAKEVYDVTGAGDTVISLIAAGLAAKLSLAEATRLANIGAGIVVGKLGTAYVSVEELQLALHASPTFHRGILPLDELLPVLASVRRAGKKLVATNGCFDILHPGHVDYLKRAQELGDYLVVLVNTDESVQRLKGPERPINPLDHRMIMLAALECVDWVVPFNEDTPRDLIGRILPDILVKGGDYTDIEHIAGHDHVLANGGEVKILNFVDGYSTTKIIEKIARSEART